jgi:hypothetical protein
VVVKIVELFRLLHDKGDVSKLGHHTLLFEPLRSSFPELAVTQL